METINDNTIYTYKDIQNFGGREHLESLGYMISELYHEVSRGNFEHNNCYQIHTTYAKK